jgi:hypothetical protein
MIHFCGDNWMAMMYSGEERRRSKNKFKLKRRRRD